VTLKLSNNFRILNKLHPPKILRASLQIQTIFQRSHSVIKRPLWVVYKKCEGADVASAPLTFLSFYRPPVRTDRLDVPTRTHRKQWDSIDHLVRRNAIRLLLRDDSRANILP
jgi:hypothetical protein